MLALLVPSLLTSCQWLVDKLLQDSWAQQTCYKLFQQLFIVLQLNNLSTSCEWQPCSNLITWQRCYNLLTSLLQACCEHILLTSCEIFTCVVSDKFHCHYHCYRLIDLFLAAALGNIVSDVSGLGYVPFWQCCRLRCLLSYIQIL
jgi:hypothetical protein